MSPTLPSSLEEGLVERTMSVPEAERAAVLARVQAERLTLREAAEVLGLSYRQAKRLLGRYRAGGAQALRHRSVGRPSNRRHLAAVQERRAGAPGLCSSP